MGGFKSKKFALLLAITISSLIMIQPISTQAAISTSNDWPSFLHDPAHTGASTGSGPTKPEVLWSYKEGTSACVVANGVVYAGGFNGNGFRSANIIAFNAYNGAKIWNYSASDLQTSPSVYGERLFIGINQTVYSFDVLTGTKIWNYTLAARVAGEPTITDGTVYVSSGSTYQYIDNGLVEVGLTECNVYAINASTGLKIWSVKTDDIPSSPAISKVDQALPMVFVRVGKNFVYALSSLYGTKVWAHDTASIITTNPMVGNGKVFICKIGESISALDAKTGMEKWNFNGPGGVQESTPAFFSGVVYVGGHNGVIYALNASTGDKIWEYKTGTQNLWGTTVAGDIVYTGSEIGKLFAVNATNGNLIWAFYADGLIRSTVVANGILYFSGGNFYAIGEHTPQYYLTAPAIAATIAVAAVGTVLAVFFWKRNQKRKVKQQLK